MFAQSKPRKKVTFQTPTVTDLIIGISTDSRYPRSSTSISDIESTCAEAGFDNELDENYSTVTRARSNNNSKRKGKMAGHTTTDDSSDTAPEWTREQDRLICAMKLDGNSWAEIGKVLKRSRRECQLRHRALIAHAKELGLTTEKLVTLYIEEDDDSDGDATPQTKSKKNRKDESKSKDSRGDEAEASTSESKKSKGKSKESTSKSAKSKSESKNKSTKKKKAVSSSSYSDSGSEAGDNGIQTEEDLAAEYWASRRYQCEVVYGQMYPDQKVLRPDRFYSESDCRVLSSLEARYRANKWLHIQADFCNATGRMVAAEILKAKFDEE